MFPTAFPTAFPTTVAATVPASVAAAIAATAADGLATLSRLGGTLTYARGVVVRLPIADEFRR